MNEVVDFNHQVIVYGLCMPRILIAFSVLPFLNKSMIGGTMIKNGIALSLALILFPVVEAQQAVIAQLSVLEIMGIILKEAIIGLLLAYIASIPFWAIESTGFFIDNQRGAAMASSVNPMSGDQTSPIGMMFQQILVTLFYSTGGILIFLGSLYSSYVLWPIVSFLPTFSDQLPTIALGMLDAIFSLTVLYAGPVVIAMFMAEMSLGLISRFAPQLNVFFLAMPVKSGVAMWVMVIYLGIMLTYFVDLVEVSEGVGLIQTLTSLFDGTGSKP
ncbi:type III secretion system export apparatus subunit SctT [Pleionea sp. CnH1-48]|uniref:type III secretion system export apparatus subunit SctT n=1 Tax=Pleionea sp. CnH1-48 TaxID=2954494 RepID=UPI002097B3BD|nr:type III secretion system export apparatus subunit SctT [Pleionea sp. CnH1-48]MCO7226994.1 type III secretion system export apparatus subunit SctT [Pleionea sp. CnH1-48]